MPVYDYVCNDCHKTFEQTLTLRQHDGQIQLSALRRQKCTDARGRSVLCSELRRKSA